MVLLATFELVDGTELTRVSGYEGVKQRAVVGLTPGSEFTMHPHLHDK